MEAIAIKTEPPEHVEATPRSSTTSAAVAAAETTKQPTTQNVAIEKSRCGEIFVTNNAKKWTFTCTYCDKTTRDIGEFICHIQFKHMNGQYNEDGGADNENELQPTTTLQNNAAEKPTNNQQPNILFQSLTQPIINEPQTQTYPVTPTIATVSSLANSNNVPFEYSDSTNESDDFNNAQQKPQHSKSLKITNPQSLNRSKRKHETYPKYEKASSEQLKYYVIFCSRHPEINMNRVGPKSKAWVQLTLALNDLNGPKRTPKKWKECLSNWKNQLRSRSRIEQANRQKVTGTESLSIEDIAFDQYTANVLNGFKTFMADHAPTTYQFSDIPAQPSLHDDIKPFAEDQDFDPSMFLHQELCTQDELPSSSKNIHKVREKVQEF